MSVIDLGGNDCNDLNLKCNDEYIFDCNHERRVDDLVDR